MVRSTILGIALASILALPAAAEAAPRILYVGDSLGVGTVSQLQSARLGMPLDADTRVGRSSTEGLAVMSSELRRSHRVVVFDLGTNDYNAATLAKNLRRARRRTGERPMIVFTMNKPRVGPFNKAVRTFARSAANVVLIDWHGVVAGKGLLGGDGIHASASGYRRRAALVMDEIERAVSRAGVRTARPGRSRSR
jgi:hypothetical protein